MSRNTTTQQNTALAQSNASLVMFVEMLFDSAPLRVCSAGYDITWNAFVWQGLGQLGTIEPIIESESQQVTGLSFTITGVPSAYLALAYNEKYQGRIVNVYVGMFALPNYTLVDAPILEWSGKLDTMNSAERDGYAAIRVTAESELFDFERPNVQYLSNEEQQRLYPGDKGLEYMAKVPDMPVIWPSRDFFRR